MPKVSVIIPNYNHHGYLIPRIESVLHQSFQDFELILLDDASSDSSITILKMYEKHSKVSHLICNDMNSGSVFKQWIKGIELAKGDYIWIAESDDFAHPDFLKHTVSELKSNQSAGLVFTDSNIVDSESNPLGLMSETHALLHQFVILGRSSLTSQDLSSYFINDLIVSNASAVLFRTSALRHLDMGMLQRLYNAGDLFTYISILLNHDIRYLHLPLNFYRTHQENETKKNARNGRLHRDRLLIVTYFAPQLITGDDKAPHLLAVFLKRHFLVSSDFGLYKELYSLLAVYRHLGIINSTIYRHLKTYCRIQGLIGKRIPYFYRAFMKRTLVSMVNT